MERVSRRRRSRRKKAQGGGGRVILALLMLGGVIYLVCVSAAGKWISDNVIVPVFEALRPAETPAAVEDEAGGAATVSLAVGADAVSVDVALPAVQCYMLQMGVFSVEENAEAAAGELRAKGAGGYILEDGGRWRVMASGYADRASASDVKERLASEGMDCTVFDAKTPEATFRVSVAKSQVEAVKSGFAALSKAQQALCAAVLEYDAASQSEAQARAAAEDILLTLKGEMEPLSGYAEQSSAIGRLVSCYDAYVAALSALASGQAQSMVDFSADIKYTQLYTTHEYMKLMENFA